MIKTIREQSMSGWQITCDGCGRKANFFVDTARDAFALARRHFWTKRSARDVCPDCES
ncbi:hypothetical protein [Rhodococcus sp. 14-2470-1a]|uniref:hypothetical protein n=1 Tax=Rhodococcus sp. 14-2470-1a TaxID=2023150 RepID=UPI0015C5DD4A|nr:hypothetical protein [Rhodococcus sp. 14-2470-1a]